MLHESNNNNHQKKACLKLSRLRFNVWASKRDLTNVKSALVLFSSTPLYAFFAVDVIVVGFYHVAFLCVCGCGLFLVV
jgi:hypothetical protein